MDILSFGLTQETEMLVKLFSAMFLGMILGIERVAAHKGAGMRTYALVSMGSALFVIISETLYQKYAGVTGIDPVRMASQIVVGIGFLGAGLIIFTDSKLIGLTTAAGLWMSGGIGVAIGHGLYLLAIAATILTLFVFTVLWVVEERLRGKLLYKEENK